MNSQPT